MACSDVSKSNEQILSQVRSQFGPNAANYATSPVHAKGVSLELLLDRVAPASHWRMLDVATAAGHTAFTFAGSVDRVMATDVTMQMLDVASDLAATRKIENVDFCAADAHRLPFADASFDLVTCRIAPHHFADPVAFVAESARVLAPGGRLGIVDNVSPADRDDARWCDDFERRRDPSHRRCLSMTEWAEAITAADLDLLSAETIGKHMDFVTWADNLSVAADVRCELLADLERVPEGARQWLRPDLGEKPSFVLTEGILVAEKPTA